MPDYLADRFAGWMGWSSPTDMLGLRPGETKTMKGRYQTRVAQGRTADDRTGLRSRHPYLEDDAGAHAGTGTPTTIASIGGFGSGMGQPFRTPVRPDYLQVAQQRAAAGDRLQAPEPPAGAMGIQAGEQATWGLRGGSPLSPVPRQQVAPMPMAPDVPMAAPGIPAPRRLPSAGPPMQQAVGAPQPPPLAPSGAAPNLLGRAASAAGDFLGGAARGVGAWMGKPVRNSGLTRGDLVFDALGNIGRGLSTTGSLSTGIAMASEGQKDLFARARKEQESEEERQYRRLEYELKKQELERKVAPEFTTAPAGSTVFNKATGEQVFTAPDKAAAPKTAQEAILSGTPEQAALGRELMSLEQQYKNAITPGEQQRIALEGRRIQVQLAELGMKKQELAHTLAQPGGLVKVRQPDGTDVWQTRAEARGKPAAPADEANAGKAAMDLRKQFEGLTKDEQSVVTAYGKIKAGFGLQTGAGDIAGIFGYMKMLDPTSAVREGEYATAANAAGVAESIRANYNRLLDGDKLTDQQRKEMEAAAGSQLGPYRERYDRLASQYSELAKRGRIDPFEVVGGGSPFPTLAPTEPLAAPGEPNPYEGLQ